jgi:hypothetical protein
MIFIFDFTVNEYFSYLFDPPNPAFLHLKFKVLYLSMNTLAKKGTPDLPTLVAHALFSLLI